MTKPQGTPQAGMNSGPVRPRNRHLPASTRSHRASLATIGREQKRCGARCRSRRGESRGGGCPKFDHGVGGSSRLDRLGLRLLDGGRIRIVGGSLGSWRGGGGRSIIGGWERDRIRGQRTEFVGRSLATCALRCLLGLSRSLPLEFGEGRARFSSHVTPSDRRPRRAPASETRRRCARSPRVTLILRASSPLRPGRNSNSTRWLFLDVLGAAAPKSGVPAVRA
jgi:hypothetical protein